MSVSETNREKMAVFMFEDYDDDEADVVVLYLIAPRRFADDALGSAIEDASICTCAEKHDAVAIADAWNAYYIKN